MAVIVEEGGLEGLGETNTLNSFLALPHPEYKDLREGKEIKKKERKDVWQRKKKEKMKKSENEFDVKEKTNAVENV